MALQIGRTVGRGSRRVLSVSGIAMLTLTLLSQVVLLGSVNTVFREQFPVDVQEEVAFGVVFPVSSTVAAVLAAAAVVFGGAVYVVGSRALSRDVSELNTLPTGLFTRRLGRATLSSLVASTVVSVLVLMGSVFVIPGLFFTVSFLFVTFAVGVEDARALPALRRSWTLAAGNRWKLLAIVLLLLVGNFLGSAVAAVFSLATPLIGQLTSLVFVSIFVVVAMGLVAEAFVQLRPDSSEEP